MTRPQAEKAPRERKGQIVRKIKLEDRDKLSLHVDVKVSAAEMRTWAPERIAALFSGIAAIVAARGGKHEG
jgi:hypothetical protein